MTRRPYLQSDLEGVIACFTQSVRVIAARLYEPGQVDAWAPATPHLPWWRERLSRGGVFVAEVEGRGQRAGRLKRAAVANAP